MFTIHMEFIKHFLIYMNSQENQIIYNNLQISNLNHSITNLFIYFQNQERKQQHKYSKINLHNN